MSNNTINLTPAQVAAAAASQATAPAAAAAVSPAFGGANGATFRVYMSDASSTPPNVWRVAVTSPGLAASDFQVTDFVPTGERPAALLFLQRALLAHREANSAA